MVVDPLGTHPAIEFSAATDPRSLPRVILLEGIGCPTGLSVARCLGRRGIRVHAISPPDSHIRYSRFVRWIPDTVAGSTMEQTADYLLGSASDWLRGSVLLACYDPGLEMLSRHRSALSKKYRLDDCEPRAQACMLDKLATYQAARAAGVPTPRFWIAATRSQVERVQAELCYPLLVKPLRSHEYRRHFGNLRKFATVENFAELCDAFEEAEKVGVEVMLMEKIPGPDDLLASYYTYLDDRANPLFDFTKRIIRRYPFNVGFATYHITDRVPELKEPSLRLFRHVGLRGLANVEFKLDVRDGQFKLIECNARFTGGNPLVAAAGYDLASFVYDRIVGLPRKPFGAFRSGLRLWSPMEDFQAFRQLHRLHRLTFFRWLQSIAHPQILPYFDWSDPRPSLVQTARRFWYGLARRLGRSP